MTSINAVTTLILGTMLFGNVGTCNANNLPMRIIATGATSGILEARQEVVKTKSEWDILWLKHSVNASAGKAVPDVDFGKEMVVVVTMGRQRTGGLTIEITKVETVGEKLVVSIKHTSPPKGAMVIQALTSPFHMVAVARNDLKPEFVETTHSTEK